MKRTHFFSCLLFFSCFISGTTLSSCGKEKGCTTLESDNFDPDAEEDDGSCIPWRDKFIGSYLVISDMCAGGTYSLSIIASTQDELKIVINNLNNVSGISLVADVSANSFTIPQVTLQGQTIFGNGQLNGDILNINYTVDDGNGSFSCSASCNKQ